MTLQELWQYSMHREGFEMEEIWNPFKELVRTGIDDLKDCSMETEEKTVNESLTYLVRLLEEE